MIFELSDFYIHMNKKELAAAALKQQKILPLYYHDDEATSIEILRALHRAGVQLIEYTNRGANALSNFRAMRKVVDAEMPGFLLGIGTIKNTQQAQAYLDAGADFIVCPSTSEAVGQLVHAHGLLWIPGAMTATEIANAENAGATIVKLFPGSLLGPSYITAVKDLFPELRFVVTGGVEAELGNLTGWFKAGAIGVGMGSKVITKELIASKDYNGIQTLTEQALQLAQSII
jgi:2-dehydro-3-deoxyphosphogluconate aldolase/(4S)-4-hydroxy-2-oxoglutarate aldolase